MVLSVISEGDAEARLDGLVTPGDNVQVLNVSLPLSALKRSLSTGRSGTQVNGRTHTVSGGASTASLGPSTARSTASALSGTTVKAGGLSLRSGFGGAGEAMQANSEKYLSIRTSSSKGAKDQRTRRSGRPSTRGKQEGNEKENSAVGGKAGSDIPSQGKTGGADPYEGYRPNCMSIMGIDDALCKSEYVKRGTGDMEVVSREETDEMAKKYFKLPPYAVRDLKYTEEEKKEIDKVIWDRTHKTKPILSERWANHQLGPLLGNVTAHADPKDILSFLDAAAVKRFGQTGELPQAQVKKKPQAHTHSKTPDPSPSAPIQQQEQRPATVQSHHRSRGESRPGSTVPPPRYATPEGHVRRRPSDPSPSVQAPASPGRESSSCLPLTAESLTDPNRRTVEDGRSAVGVPRATIRVHHRAPPSNSTRPTSATSATTCTTCIEKFGNTWNLNTKPELNKTGMEFLLGKNVDPALTLASPRTHVTHKTSGSDSLLRRSVKYNSPVDNITQSLQKEQREAHLARPAPVLPTRHKHENAPPYSSLLPLYLTLLMERIERNRRRMKDIDRGLLQNVMLARVDDPNRGEDISERYKTVRRSIRSLKNKVIKVAKENCPGILDASDDMTTVISGINEGSRFGPADGQERERLVQFLREARDGSQRNGGPRDLIVEMVKGMYADFLKGTGRERGGGQPLVGTTKDAVKAILSVESEMAFLNRMAPYMVAEYLRSRATIPRGDAKGPGVPGAAHHSKDPRHVFDESAEFSQLMSDLKEYFDTQAVHKAESMFNVMKSAMEGTAHDPNMDTTKLRSRAIHALRRMSHMEPREDQRLEYFDNRPTPVFTKKILY